MKFLRWSLPLCRVAGIRIQVHATFGFLLAWIWLAGYDENGVLGAVWATAFLVSIFLCVVLHELGHSLVAQRLGVSVRDITLLPIGGVASLRSIPEDPKQELAITIAGPMVNVVIFAALYLAAVLASLEGPFPLLLDRLPARAADLWGAMLSVNLMMVVFNLIPAFPMDGGRILRALLVRWLGYVRATQVAAYVGQAFAALFLVAAFALPPLVGEQGIVVWLIVIAGLIYFAAGAENNMVRLRGVLRGVRVGDVMTHGFVSLSPNDYLGDCLEKSVRTGQEDFPVLRGEEMVGLLERDDFRAALRKTGPRALVGDVMCRVFPVLSPDTDLAEVHTEMLGAGWLALPVRRNGELVGWLSRENIARYFALHESLPKTNPSLSS